VNIARAYGADIVVGLVCAGIMTIEDVETGAKDRMQFVPTRLLLAELSQRGEQNRDIAPGLAIEWDHYTGDGTVSDSTSSSSSSSSTQPGRGQ
jgi:hypothetical protein